MNIPHTVIILAAGRGTRLKPLTDKTPKVMVEVGGVPMSRRIVDECTQAGVTRIVFVVGYLADVIKSYYGDGSSWESKFYYVEQQELDGTGGALKSAMHYLTEDFAVIFGDGYYDEGTVRSFLQNEFNLSIAVTPVSDPQRYGVVEVEDNKRISNITEKPSIPKSNLAIAGMYKLTPKCVEYLRIMKISERNEFELTAPVNDMVNKRVEIFAHEIDMMIDIGTIEHLNLINEKVKNKKHN